MSNSRSDNDQAMENVIKASLDALAIGADGLNSLCLSEIDQMGLDKVSNRYIRNALIAPAFAIELCKNILPHMREKDSNRELKNNFENILLKSTINFLVSNKMGLSVPQQVMVLEWEKIGDVLLDANEMAALEQSISNLHSKIKEGGLSFGEHTLLRELCSLKHDSILYGNLFKLPARFTEFINNTLFEMFKCAESYIPGSAVLDFPNSNEQMIAAGANTTTTTTNIVATSSQGAAAQFIEASHDDSTLGGNKKIAPEMPGLGHQFMDAQVKLELAKEINLEQVRSRIRAAFDYSSPRDPAYTFNFPTNHWQSGSDEGTSRLVARHVLAGGSIQASNNNRDGQFRWHVDLPLPLGIAVLGLRMVFSRDKNSSPEPIRQIHESITLLEDSYKKVSPGNLSFSSPGFKNFFEKNLHGLSKNQLIGLRAQNVISAIERAINTTPSDIYLRKECGYIILAIKNNDPEMLNLVFSHQDPKLAHEKLGILYQKHLVDDIEYFNSINKTQCHESFQAANDLVAKYPYEAVAHKIMAYASRNIKNYELSLNEIEHYRSLVELDLSARQANSNDNQQVGLSDANGSRRETSIRLRQLNTSVNHCKIDVLRCAIDSSHGELQNQYKGQLVNLLHDMLAANPLNVSCYDILVDLYLRDKQIDVAINYQQKIVELNNSPLALIRLAELHFQNNDNVMANEALDKLGKEFKHGSKADYDAQSYLREWYIEQGDYEKAYQHANVASSSPHASSIDQNRKVVLGDHVDRETSIGTGSLTVAAQDTPMKMPIKLFQHQAGRTLLQDCAARIHSKTTRNAITKNRQESLSGKCKIATEKISKIARDNAILLEKMDAFVSLASVLLNLKLRDRTISETTRKQLMAVTTMISHVRSLTPFVAKMMRPDKVAASDLEKLKAVKDAHIQNLNILITCLAVVNWVLQELQEHGVLNKFDDKTQMRNQIAFATVSLAPALCELGFMIKDKVFELSSAVFCVSSLVSTGMHIHQLKCRYDNVPLMESYNYHFLANSLWIAPAVLGVSMKLGVGTFAAAKLTAGFAIIWVEPITGTILIAEGAGTLGGIAYATYLGIDYSSKSDRANSLVFNGKLLAEKGDYLAAIDKLDESLACMPDPRVEMQRALYYCQHHFIKENIKDVNEEADKWLQNAGLEAGARLQFLNFRILTSIKNTGVSQDAEELMGMYLALAGAPDNTLKPNEAGGIQLKNNLSMLLCKSATETTDHDAALKKLDFAKALTPDNNSIPTLRRSIEYDFDYKNGNQIQLLSKCASMLEANPQDILSLKYAGLIALQQKKYKTSQNYFILWAQTEPDDLNPHIYLSRSALIQNDFVTANIHAKNALDLSLGLYNAKAKQTNADEAGTVEVTSAELAMLKSQYLESKQNYDAIQKGIATLYSCSFAQSAGKVSAEAIGLLAGSVMNSFSSGHAQNTASRFSFSMWQKPGSYCKNTGTTNRNEYSRRFF